MENRVTPTLVAPFKGDSEAIRVGVGLRNARGSRDPMEKLATKGS